MIHGLKVLATKTEGLSLIARIHMVERENQLQSCSLNDRRIHREREAEREERGRKEKWGKGQRLNVIFLRKKHVVDKILVSHSEILHLVGDKG